MFERKGYTGAALDQLTEWAKKNNLIYKLIAIRPKWGLDFSIDYVDKYYQAGNPEYDYCDAIREWQTNGG